MSKYLTTDESVQLLGVSARTLRRYVHRGLLTKITEKGRVLYPSAEVEQLAQHRSRRGSLGLIEERVAALVAKNIALEVRVRILETALSSRQPDAKLTEDEIKEVRSAVIATSRKKEVTYETADAWADDLLRLDQKTCGKIGYKRLKTLVTRLTLAVDASPETYREPSRILTSDKLRIFEIRLRGFAGVSASPSGARSRQDAAPES